MTRHILKSRVLLTASTAWIALSSAFSGGVANAQAAADAPAIPSADEGSNSIDEIFVTAQKRAESAQDVPISVQVMRAAELQRAGITQTTDLPLVVPGFQISSSASNNLYYLRGVGSQQVGTSSSPEVATFIDGVYMPFAVAALQGLGDVASVEVDKGPQGTLFGRNSTGGVIQIRTRDPEHELGGEIAAGYGNYDHAVSSLYLTGGLTENVAASIALQGDVQNEGYGTSIATGADIFKEQIYAGRVTFLADFSERVRLRLSGNYSDVEGDAGSVISPAEGVQLWNQVTSAQQVIPGFYDSNQNDRSFHDVELFGFNGNLMLDLGWAELTSISAYQELQGDTYVDFDGAPQTFLPVSVFTNEDAFSQELQLSSPTNSSLIWTAGLFYFERHGRTAPFQYGSPFATIVLPFGIPMGDTYETYSKTSTTSLAGYGEVTAAIFEDTRLTLGARYTQDENTISGYGQISGPVPPAPLVLPFTVGQQTATFREPTYRVALSHDFSPHVLGYVSFNRGYQAGVFNSNNLTGFSAAANPVLEPENIDAYEIGVKSELFDRRLRLNVAAFHYDYTNLQQQIYVNGSLRTLNAGAAEIQGVDFEAVYQPNDDLTIGLVGEFLDPTFTDYVNAPGYVYPQGFGVGPLVPTPIPNAKGNDLLFAPRFTGTFYVSHVAETSVGEFTTSANVAYNDGYYADPGNLYKEPSFVVVNLSEQWAPTETFSLQAWVRNAFDEEYDQSVAAVGTVGFVGNNKGAPREFGVTARYRF